MLDEVATRMDDRALHLSKANPALWERMTEGERISYDMGWGDATLRLVPEISEARPAAPSDETREPGREDA